jgi:hypothetical protein
MSRTHDQSLLEAPLDSWDRNNIILLNLLRAVPEGGLEARVMGGSPRGRTMSAVTRPPFGSRSGQLSRKAREGAHPQLFHFNDSRNPHYTSRVNRAHPPNIKHKVPPLRRSSLRDDLLRSG